MAKNEFKYDLHTKALTGGVLLGTYTLISIILENYAIGGFLFSARVLGIISSVVPFVSVGSLKGALAGLVGGFVVGFIACYVYGWTYNKLLGRCPCPKCKK